MIAAMVRREAEEAQGLGAESARCAFPAGGSPASVSTGAPSSRPQAGGGDPDARAGRQEPARRRKPRSGEQAHGPQHEVKPAASTDKQSGSRAAHFTAKATLPAGAPEPVGGPGGVRGAARVQGSARNTRGPSAQPPSRQARPYKPKAKSGRAQRESEGTVVPEIAAANNVAGGKGPWGGGAAGAGKREGMAAASGPNDPGGRRPRGKVRQLQRRLWSAAKRHPARRFHALYDHLSRGDILREAWRRVRSKQGAAGVDAETIADVEQYGVERFVEELGAVLRAQRYRPGVVLRRYIPKADGRKRPLGIPTVPANCIFIQRQF